MRAAKTTAQRPATLVETTLVGTALAKMALVGTALVETTLIERALGGMAVVETAGSPVVQAGCVF
ncbi:hypothetical protein [Nonomuraea dietziae]|uniref:hypothetical protein n=1 Tax=Nonomuraea dietziae TaxID=65515 RepID=UPI00341CE3D9